MDYDKKTFCAAPWFQIRNEQMGTYQVCCFIDPKKTQYAGKNQYVWPESTPDQYLDSDYVHYLRENLTNGTKLPECDHCWKKEHHGGHSARMAINDTVTKNNGHDIDSTWLGLYLKTKNTYTSDLVLSAEIKLSNVCNFSCMMCHPGDSSQIYNAWHRDRSHPIIKEILDTSPGFLDKVRENYKSRNNYDLLRNILEKKPRHLKLLGGEPLLDRAALEMLSQVPDNDKSKMSLLFVTNGSVDLNSISHQLDGYQDVNYIISLEGVGAVQDYIRRGSVWSDIQENIKSYQKEHPKKILKAHVTVQALNLMHLPDISDWADSANVEVGYFVTHRPEFMTLSAIPVGLRPNIVQRLQNKRSGHKDDLDFISILNHHSFDSTMLDKFRRYLDWYDPQKTWKNIFPEWIPYL